MGGGPRSCASSSSATASFSASADGSSSIIEMREAAAAAAAAAEGGFASVSSSPSEEEEVQICRAGRRDMENQKETASLLLPPFKNISSTYTYIQHIHILVDRCLFVFGPLPSAVSHPSPLFALACVCKTISLAGKYRCKKRYDSIVPLLSDILLELWYNLLAVVRGQYDNMSGPSEVVLKKRKKLLQLWRKLPLFTISSHGPIWRYHHPWPFP